jgi:hypothetical protein
MVASHPKMFSISMVNEADLALLVEDGLLAPQVVLQWLAAYGEDIPTHNTQEILVMKPHFQRGFGLPACNFFRGLLDHYKIELVHLNSNSILQIAIFVHLCKVFLGIPPHFRALQTLFLSQIPTQRRKPPGHKRSRHLNPAMPLLPSNVA